MVRGKPRHHMQDQALSPSNNRHPRLLRYLAVFRPALAECNRHQGWLAACLAGELCRVSPQDRKPPRQKQLPRHLRHSGRFAAPRGSRKLHWFSKGATTYDSCQFADPREPSRPRCRGHAPSGHEDPHRIHPCLTIRSQTQPTGYEIATTWQRHQGPLVEEYLPQQSSSLV